MEVVQHYDIREINIPLIDLKLVHPQFLPTYKPSAESLDVKLKARTKENLNRFQAKTMAEKIRHRLSSVNKLKKPLTGSTGLEKLRRKLGIQNPNKIVKVGSTG